MEYPSLFELWTARVPVESRAEHIAAIARKHLVGTRTAYRCLHGLTRPNDRTKRIYADLFAVINKYASAIAT